MSKFALLGSLLQSAKEQLDIRLEHRCPERFGGKQCGQSFKAQQQLDEHHCPAVGVVNDFNQIVSAKDQTEYCCHVVAWTMYHGTTRAAADQIERGGIRASTGGMLGAGVYAIRDIKKARR